MEHVTGKYGIIISKAISKYGDGLPRSDHDDLRQEAELALFKSGEVNDRLAYTIVKRIIISYLRRQPPRMENIDDPGIRKKYERQTTYQPNYDRKLDGEKAVNAMASLPEPLRAILYGSFIEGDTDKKLAGMFGVSEDWILRKKYEGIQRLKEMLS